MNMFKQIAFALLLCISTLSWAQEAVVSGGNYLSNANGSVSWGLGEAVIQTFATDDNIVTQGFQQTRLTITSVEEIPGLDFAISAYPNPAHDIVNLKVDTDDLKGLLYEVFDQNGRMLKRGVIDNNPMSIQVSSMPIGVCFIRVIHNSKMLNTFKIVKQ
ncbi:MAG TPA: T9SS type A sorting domain-containing protein [Tenuifilaceae bacterium]|nr:T9SS type A sorting domain-containing protein [Bacteroidales bacterium]HNV82590.1 T9SS type A sorting domain-containing protein [Tenuifilaceae bacterium]